MGKAGIEQRLQSGAGKYSFGWIRRNDLTEIRMERFSRRLCKASRDNEIEANTGKKMESFTEVPQNRFIPSSFDHPVTGKMV